MVDATSASGHTLDVNSGSTGATNAGLFEASSGGSLAINGTLTNTGGTIEGLAGTGSNAGGSVLINGATIDALKELDNNNSRFVLAEGTIGQIRARFPASVALISSGSPRKIR